jgi:hypothetical protein
VSDAIPPRGPLTRALPGRGASHCQAGATSGGLVGSWLRMWLPGWNIQPGLYSLMAATATLGGVFRCGRDAHTLLFVRAKAGYRVGPQGDFALSGRLHDSPVPLEDGCAPLDWIRPDGASAAPCASHVHRSKHPLVSIHFGLGPASGGPLPLVALTGVASCTRNLENSCSRTPPPHTHTASQSHPQVLLPTSHTIHTSTHKHTQTHTHIITHT